MSIIFDEIESLKKQVAALSAMLNQIMTTNSTKPRYYNNPNSIEGHFKKGAGGLDSGATSQYGQPVCWNNLDLLFLPIGTKPESSPVGNHGYNIHLHNQYSGGALDINALELVEYNVDFDTSATYSKYSPSLWSPWPTVKIMDKQSNNGGTESIEKLGKLDVVFNPNSGKWNGVAGEIDVRKCYFVSRDPLTGEIEVDENGTEKKSLIYNEDITKTAVIWDKNASCWRWFAVYADSDIE